VVPVPQYIPHTAEALPINARTQAIPIISQANRSLDDLHLPLHGGLCFLIPAIGIKVHIAEKCIDIIDAFEDVPQVLVGVSKRQEPPPAKLVDSFIHSSEDRSTLTPSKSVRRLYSLPTVTSVNRFDLSKSAAGQCQIPQTFRPSH
jgi:hypothetical protein